MENNEQNTPGQENIDEAIEGLEQALRSELNKVKKCKTRILRREIEEAVKTVESDEAQNLLDAQKKFAPVVIEMPDGNDITVDGTSAIRQEVEELTKEQRLRMAQYEHDRNFFDASIAQDRKLSEIPEDYIKILHPFYRLKLVEAIQRYGTLEAGVSYMMEKYRLRMHISLIKRLRNIIPVFAQEVDDAIAVYHGSIQREIHRRAVEGIDKPVYHNGEIINVEKQYSDNLLTTLAQTQLEDYKELKLNKDGKRSHTVNVQIIKDFHNYKRDGGN